MTRVTIILSFWSLSCSCIIYVFIICAMLPTVSIRYIAIVSITYVLLYTTVLSAVCADPSHFAGLDEDNDKTLGQKFFNRFYLAICTVTTLSFGDIYPKTKTSKILVMTFSFVSAMALASQILGVPY